MLKGETLKFQVPNSKDLVVNQKDLAETVSVN